jgi:uncharacterized membrane protein
MPYVVAYIGTAIVFFAIDYVWLSRVAFGFYREQIGHVLLDQPNLAAAGAFYLFYIGGIVYFAVAPAMQSGNWTQALIAGAILGLVAYGTYDMTNLATIRDWSVSVTIIDILWGAALTGTAATAGYFATRLLGASN